VGEGLSFCRAGRSRCALLRLSFRWCDEAIASAGHVGDVPRAIPAVTQQLRIAAIWTRRLPSATVTPSQTCALSSLWTRTAPVDQKVECSPATRNRLVALLQQPLSHEQPERTEGNDLVRSRVAEREHRRKSTIPNDQPLGMSNFILSPSFELSVTESDSGRVLRW
jgi:hypothetical protein